MSEPTRKFGLTLESAVSTFVTRVAIVKNLARKASPSNLVLDAHDSSDSAATDLVTEHQPIVGGGWERIGQRVGP